MPIGTYRRISGVADDLSQTHIRKSWIIHAAIEFQKLSIRIT